MNKKGFILYDGILSILVLSSITLLFCQMMQISLKNYIIQTNNISQITQERENLYNKSRINE